MHEPSGSTGTSVAAVWRGSRSSPPPCPRERTSRFARGYHDGSEVLQRLDKDILAHRGMLVHEDSLSVQRAAREGLRVAPEVL